LFIVFFCGRYFACFLLPKDLKVSRLTIDWKRWKYPLLYSMSWFFFELHMTWCTNMILFVLDIFLIWQLLLTKNKNWSFVCWQYYFLGWILLCGWLIWTQCITSTSSFRLYHIIEFSFKLLFHVGRIKYYYFIEKLFYFGIGWEGFSELSFHQSTDKF
jgi:hypothetical protein